MRRHLLPLFSLALLGSALLWPASASLQTPRAADASTARLEGTWRLVQSPSEADRIVDRAVDQAVDAMSFFARPIARPRLREGTAVNRRIALDFEGERATVRFSARGDSYTTRLGRTERRRDGDGEVMRVTQRFRDDGTFEQVFAADGGTRWYVYTPVDDDTVRVEVITDSPRMPRAMRFTLDYRR